MNYKDFLQQKVDQAREQIQSSQYRSNAEVNTECAAQRTELANRFEATRIKTDLKWCMKDLMALLRGKTDEQY